MHIYIYIILIRYSIFGISNWIYFERIFSSTSPGTGRAAGTLRVVLAHRVMAESLRVHPSQATGPLMAPALLRWVIASRWILGSWIIVDDGQDEQHLSVKNVRDIQGQH